MVKQYNFIATVLVLLAFASFTQAQTGQGVVTGTVTDPAGAAMAGASVTITNQGTNIKQVEKTGGDGVYRFSLVPPGSYVLSVTAPGFNERQIKGILVDPSQTTAVNATLSVATATTTVEVSSQAPLVQTTTSDLNITVNTTTIANTALLTRNVFSLAFLAPQVTQGMNLNPASGGARESGTAYLLNGADNNDNFSEGAVNVNPPLESVGEFTILTNSFGAQYGRAAGAVVSASQKSGTNQFHGVLYEFNRNRSFNASDFFQNRQGSPKPKYIRNQFGGELDGPIVKNKTFFAFAYDQVTLHTGSELDVQVPTPSELAAIKSGAGPLATSLLSKYQLQTSTRLCPDEASTAPDAIGHIGCLHVQNPISQPQHNYFGRVDQNFSGSDRLTFTANFTRLEDDRAFGGGFASTTVAIPSHEPQHNHNLALVETHVFSPRLINEFTLAHNRHYDNYFQGTGQTTDPEIIIDGADYGLGFSFGPYSESVVEAFTQDRWQAQDNLSFTKGKHNFKFGGGWQYGIVYRNWDLGGPGQYEFGNTTGVTPAQAGVLGPNGVISGISDSSISNFQKDFSYFEETSINPHTGVKADAYRHYASKDTFLFINDDWKISKRLTLNLGLRWDRFGAPYEVNGKLAQFTNLTCLTPTCIANARVGPVSQMWKTNNKDFGPRFGFAWDIFGNGSTSLRGGYGISYDRIFDNIWSNGAWNPPFYALVDFDATLSDAIYYSLPTSVGPAYKPDTLPGSSGRVSVRTMDVHLKDTSVQNFYLAVEHQFFHDFLVRVNYQGSQGRHLPQLQNLNRYDGLRYNANLSLVQPNALYTGFNYRANNVNSNYNALVTEVQKRFSKGLQFQFGYTWSKLMDRGSDLFSGETSQGQYSQPYYQVSNAHPEFEYGPGAFDHTHNFKFNFIWELPFLRDQRGFFGHAIGGWTLSSFYQGYSGHPIEVYNSRSRFVGNALDPNGFKENIGGDYNLDGVGTDRPIYVGGTANAAYSHFSPADGIFLDNHKIGCGFAGAKSTNIAACNTANGVSVPNALFINPPGYGVRYGSLGRNVFRGPWFNGINAALIKNFKASERIGVQLRFEALNVINHPNFDGIVSNLNSTNFGRAQFLAGDAPARRLQLGARLTF
ncbi:MAG: TonB-dependent receptor domain-containing protein [Bryobacteraceae bacterium]